MRDRRRRRRRRVEGQGSRVKGQGSKGQWSRVKGVGEGQEECHAGQEAQRRRIMRIPRRRNASKMWVDLQYG